MSVSCLLRLHGLAKPDAAMGNGGSPPAVLRREPPLAAILADTPRGFRYKAAMPERDIPGFISHWSAASASERANS